MPSTSPSTTRLGFDYDSLDAATSEFVQQQTGEIRGLIKRTGQDIIDLGQRLIEVKEKLGHGRFGTWLASEFNWTDRTARQFMRVAETFKSENLSDLSFDTTALYELAAPSTPETARSEALARAASGESISYTTAKAIKQKYSTPNSKPKREPKREPQAEPLIEPQLEPLIEPQPEPLPLKVSVPPQHAEARTKQEIIALIPRRQEPIVPQTANSTFFNPAPSPEQTEPIVSQPSKPGVWWQLGGRHLVYCGDPNSPEFLLRVKQAYLLLAFPPTRVWQSTIPCEIGIKIVDYLPLIQNRDQLDEAVESAILLYSRPRDTVVSCFMPSVDILSIINRSDRLGIVADPDPKRYNAVISDWKKAGLKAERVN